MLKKSELQKKLMEREDMRKRKEFEEYKLLKRSSLEIQLEERANRLKKVKQNLQLIFQLKM